MQPAILYVEDDLLSCKVMEMLLMGRLGLQNVTIFQNSQDIVERVQLLDPQPDVIFLDIHLQPYDGIEILHMLRGLPAFADTPMVALTASVMSEEVQRLQRAGFNGCLSKPIDVDNFSSLLKQIVSGESIWHIEF